MAKPERNEEGSFGSRSNGTLIFPQDMDQQFYPEAIKFTIYERQGVSYAKVKNAFVSTGETGSTQEISAKISEIDKEESEIKKQEISDAEKGEKLKATSTNRNKAQGQRQGLLNNLADAGNSFTRIKDEFLSSGKQTATDRHIQSIYLNMPASVLFSEGVEWQGADLGIIGAMQKGGVGNAIESGVLSGAGAMLGGGAGGLIGMIPGLSGVAAGVVGAAVGSGALQNSLESSFNVKANPYKEQTFQGVGFRPFDYSFILRARSDSDVDTIQQIIRAFRAYSKPSFQSQLGQSGVFSYPKEFRIEYLTIGSDNSYETNEYLPEIKYCVCTAVNTNFTTSGWKSFEGGAPVDITLQLTFQETEIITQEDVLGNTKVGRFAGGTRRF